MNIDQHSNYNYPLHILPPLRESLIILDNKTELHMHRIRITAAIHEWAMLYPVLPYIQINWAKAGVTLDRLYL